MMWKTKTTRLAAVLAFGLAAHGALADGSVLTVSLWDKGETSMDRMDSMAPMMMGSGAGMSMATMGVTADPGTVPAGEVTFNVTNASKGMVHEMIVAPVAPTETALPYDSGTMRVDEEAAGALGEVEELEPGETGSLSLNLKKGTYILFCNIPGHYRMGMWTLLNVG
jgi:uncharacterized cupredoxin-like copper-binding protein